MIALMTPEEIRRDWRAAKFPDLQIRILAELNDVSVYEIRRICGLPEKRRFAKGTNGYSAGEVTELVSLWQDGVTVREIAARLGRSQYAIQQFTANHRDWCPRRQKEKL